MKKCFKKFFGSGTALARPESAHAWVYDPVRRDDYCWQCKRFRKELMEDE